MKYLHSLKYFTSYFLQMEGTVLIWNLILNCWLNLNFRRIGYVTIWNNFFKSNIWDFVFTRYLVFIQFEGQESGHSSRIFCKKEYQTSSKIVKCLYAEFKIDQNDENGVYQFWVYLVMVFGQKHVMRTVSKLRFFSV